MTLNNDRDEVLGHGAFFDYPNTADVDPAQWEQWLNDHFGAEKCSALNTLFLHYFVSKAEYSHGAAREIIRTMFNAVPDIHYCLLVVPSGVRAGGCWLHVFFCPSLVPQIWCRAEMSPWFCSSDSALANLFEEMHLSEGAKAPHGCTVFACYRHDHIPVLHVRHAKYVARKMIFFCLTFASSVLHCDVTSFCCFPFEELKTRMIWSQYSIVTAKC